MTKSGYYGNPTLHDDTVVFVCEDDLWTVPAAGGVARRLTVNPGRVATPALSPDGKTVAFAGFDEGTSEVYVIPAEGFRQLILNKAMASYESPLRSLFRRFFRE